MASLLLFNLVRQLQQLENKPPGLLLLLVWVSIKSTAETLKLCTHWYRTVIIDAHARMFSLARG